MKNAPPTATFLEDYKPLAYKLTHIDLCFELDDENTIVTSEMKMHRQSNGEESLVLNGVDLKLLSIKIDGRELEEGEYLVESKTLTIHKPPQAFSLEVKTAINPLANTALDGLYKSGEIFCTQNEPQGFRRITYFFDRPDAMAVYRTKIIADKKSYPILLSNGNEISKGDLDNGKHWVQWEDPFAKPCYLFALVAGDLGSIKDTFTTHSGRVIDLRIYCDKGNEEKCWHAMRSLQKSMKWDEEVFGLEYDLDIFMIVAVDSFNFGAMENKGLNIFNTSCILADEATATDDNFLRVEGVVAHEYFHNWTGNRVTCRDWFQLTLKEGLTVFRDQEFSSDMNSRPVQRIDDVIALRTAQFFEDSGPTAHPIKPKSYIQINNFYTSTIYNKGAEVIRMIQTLIGKEAFRKGIDKYFELYDGQAVTTEDFVHAMEIASGKNLAHFSRWYHQSGTPNLKFSFEYSGTTFTMHVEQVNVPTSDQKEKEPLLIPLSVGLLDDQGNDIPIPHSLLQITEEKQTFTFENIPTKPTPSLNRNFSAPITVTAPYSREEEVFLMSHDSDPFNRWDAGQELATKILLEAVEGKTSAADEGFLAAIGHILSDPVLDDALKAKALVLPSESSLAQRQETIDFDGIHTQRQTLKKAIGSRYYDRFKEVYTSLQDSKFSLDPEAMGRRALKNICLGYMTHTAEKEALSHAYRQYENATNMTDSLAALTLLSHHDIPEYTQALTAFYNKWKREILVMCKWITVQTLSTLPGALQRTQAIMKDPIFDIKIPNLTRALLGSFTSNHVQFHARDGSGYAFLADQIIVLDTMNPQVASRLMTGFQRYKKLDTQRQQQMKTALDRILDKKDLSTNVYEIASKCLG
ncbi:MAG: aminopeptidase N [Chlamydiales bacterium]|nr:aminopeptidase N [Chlamydiia bacterium]MCP5508580.1 aminopeptidase N [Chlamydiales bacterium]